MKGIIRFALLLAACALFLQSGWVSYSQEAKCPATPKYGDMTVEQNFLAAHGLTQEEFSIWLKEHSVWRKKYSKQLKDFTFIPQDYDPERK
jgi:hypothetical protein